jgi:nitric oxide reductase NorD protein
MPRKPLTTQEIEDQLDEYLDAVLSTRRNARGLAQRLARATRQQQDFVLRWVGIITKTNAELAYQFASRAPEALQIMDREGTEQWLIHAVDVYDKFGLYPAITTLNEFEHYAREVWASARGVAFDDVAGVLQLVVQGLGGRALRLESNEDAYTDTTSLFLPPRLTVFDKHSDNSRLYKAITAHLWAQTWYGTFREHSDTGTDRVRDGAGWMSVTKAVSRFDDPARAVRVFHALETIRLDACIHRDLVGLHRDMAQLQRKVGSIAYPRTWRTAIKVLQRPNAMVRDSYEYLPQLYAGDLPEPLCYQGNLFPEKVEKAISERIARERNAFGNALARIAKEWRGAQTDDDQQEGAESSLEQIKLTRITDPDRPDIATFEFDLDGQLVTPTADARALMGSIVQDFGDIPPDYLVAAGDANYVRDGTQEKDPADVWKGSYHEEGAFSYNEWDYRRQHYRKNWCVLRELDVHPLDEPFVDLVLDKYGGLLSHLRKTFEALRGEDTRLKKQKNGDNIDVDAVVEGYADLCHGIEMPERLFIKKHKLDRNIAVMFMVDMSGSTKGWVNNAERESLVLLCEALEILGDRYAIYGFSGMTRKRCELFRVKSFEETYSETVKKRITGMRPQDYTRMGVIIRHLTKLLNAVEARTKVLITLSDGKPDDYDGYRGDYGIEDTRRALIEAKQAGIHPFCITIDDAASDYLPHMYGAVNYTLVNDVRKLPLRVADIYRNLTF